MDWGSLGYAILWCTVKYDEMNKHLIIYVIVGLLVIGLGVFIIFKTGILSSGNMDNNNALSTGQLPNTATSSAQSNQTPVPAVTDFPNAPQGATFQIGTSKGLITINNFYTFPLIVDEEFLILQNNDQYQINYNTEINQFYIYFSVGPSSTFRNETETAFLNLLGISESDACKLNVAEGYPGNLPSAPQQQGLSFCSAGGAFQN